MIQYNILSTGSRGNAVVINSNILIDCGVPFRMLADHYKSLRLVLLTHLHGDHFNKSCIRALARERPTLRFGCGRWLIESLLQCGVPAANIDHLAYGQQYKYGSFQVIPFPLIHNVPNQGYKVHFGDGNKMIYATDTNSLHGISAPDYDLYLIEANHEEDVIKERIAQKHADGQYAYEEQAAHNHLSKEKADTFLYENRGEKGVYEYLHCHQDREGSDGLHGEDNRLQGRPTRGAA